VLCEGSLYFTLVQFSEGAVQGKSGGGVTYGGLDATNCGPNIDYISLTSATYYQFNIDG
jgi:hypothetical protein